MIYPATQGEKVPSDIFYFFAWHVAIGAAVPIGQSRTKLA